MQQLLGSFRHLFVNLQDATFLYVKFSGHNFLDAHYLLLASVLADCVFLSRK